MADKPGLLTKRFRLTPITPDMVSDDWVRWTSDPELMKRLNSRPLNLKRADLQRYVEVSIKSGRGIVGIYTKRTGEHVGLYETVGSKARHANVTVDVLVDPNKYDLSNVLSETDPVLFDFFATRLKAEKVVAKVVETNIPVLRHFEKSGWRREGVLRQEYPSADGTKRVDVIQFGKLLIQLKPGA